MPIPRRYSRKTNFSRVKNISNFVLRKLYRRDRNSNASVIVRIECEVISLVAVSWHQGMMWTEVFQKNVAEILRFLAHWRQSKPTA
jgi:hypothetical protein